MGSERHEPAVSHNPVAANQAHVAATTRASNNTSSSRVPSQVQSIASLQLSPIKSIPEKRRRYRAEDVDSSIQDGSTQQLVDDWGDAGNWDDERVSPDDDAPSEEEDAWSAAFSWAADLSKSFIEELEVGEVAFADDDEYANDKTE